MHGQVAGEETQVVRVLLAHMLDRFKGTADQRPRRITRVVTPVLGRRRYVTTWYDPLRQGLVEIVLVRTDGVTTVPRLAKRAVTLTADHVAAIDMQIRHVQHTEHVGRVERCTRMLLLLVPAVYDMLWCLGRSMKPVVQEGC